MDAAGQLVERYGALNGGPLAPSIGLIWDCNGNFGVIDQASFRLYWFPGDRLPATIGVQIGPGGFDRARDGTIFVASTSWRRIVPPNAETILVQYLPDAVALSVAIDENGDAYVAVRVANIGGRIYKYPRGDIASGLVLSSNIANANKMALHMGEHRRTLYLATSSDIWRVDRETGSMASLFHQPPETEVSLGYGLTSYDPPEPGDLNCDGWIDNFDIDPFILALVDPAAYDAQYFFCDRQFADLNGDGSADLFDIDPFISALLAPPTP